MRARPKRRRSQPEAELGNQLHLAGLPEPCCEYRFAPPRRWRMDFAWPEHKVAAEVDGGVYTQGRHTRGKGFERDCEKVNKAVCLGWRVLRFTPKMVESGEALQVLEEVLG